MVIKSGSQTLSENASQSENSAKIFCDHRCLLGEGPIWHPERQSLLWCDIEGKKLCERKWNDGTTTVTPFSLRISAALYIDEVQVLIVAEDGLYIHNLITQNTKRHCDLETDRNDTRSNDARVHPSGAAWLGTMALNKKDSSGAIYHYLKGKIQVIIPDICISNAICFSRDGRRGYYADSPKRTIWQIDLNPDDGTPVSKPSVFKAFRDGEGTPDGAVMDSAGTIWNAVWGGSRVQSFDDKGAAMDSYALPISQTTCPAFGGPDMRHIFVTSAQENMSQEERLQSPMSGMTFVVESKTTGVCEPRVAL